jgi:hypothetical protein
MYHTAQQSSDSKVHAAPARGAMTPVKRIFFAAPLALFMLFSLPSCIEHRVAVHPPTAAAPEPPGENKTHTFMIAGSRFQNDGTTPETFSSPLPLDIPVSAYRRQWDGSIERGEVRCKTPLTWWQRFPADVFVDFAPFSARCATTEQVYLSPVLPTDRAHLLEQAARDGYARK